jgi:hypothetical protein
VRLTAAALVLLALAGPAAARPYEAFIDVASEDELADLHAADQIGDDTFEALRGLLARGVDLERASRDELYALPNLTYADVDAILAYRRAQQGIGDPAALVAAGAISEASLLSIAAFLIVGAEPRHGSPVHGRAELRTRWTATDEGAPPVALRARAAGLRHLDAGVAATVTRDRLGAVAYDPERDALIAGAPAPGLAVPKVYVRWHSERVTAIAGSYRAGFGQRLTFDTTGDATPDGFVADDQIVTDRGLTRSCRESRGEIDPTCDGDRYASPDFGWRDGLFGAAAGVRAGRVAAYAWGSWHRRSVYQYELYDRSRCADPRASDTACDAPAVYRRPDGDPAAPTTRMSFSTLPDVMVERVAGGHAAFIVDRRTRVGITGYAADSRDRVDGIELDYQEWASRPAGGRFGAVGVDGRVGLGWLDLAGEVTRSVDAMPDGMGRIRGGGPAAVARATLADRERELEVSARYLGTDFVNPLARPEAAADELEGQRARDEAGARVGYTGRHGALTVRSGVDGWRTLSDRIWKAEAFARGDVAVRRDMRAGVAVDASDKGLGGTACDAAPMSDGGAAEPCAGRALAWAARLAVDPTRRLSLSSQLRHRILEDGALRHDLSAWLVAAYRPVDGLHLRGRVRYLSEDVAGAPGLEESLWTYLDASLRLRDRDQLRVRGDLYVWLDDRDSTRARSPSPELWLWLEYEARY